MYIRTIDLTEIWQAQFLSKRYISFTLSVQLSERNNWNSKLDMDSQDVGGKCSLAKQNPS